MKEALKLALEALETGKPMFDAYWGGSQFDNAIIAIKEALKEDAMYEVQRLGQEIQPEQEQQIQTLKRCLFQMQEAAKDLVEQAKSLTPPQRTWVGLTDEQLNKAAMKLADCMDYPWDYITKEGQQCFKDHAKAIIEAAHGIKE